MQLSHLDGINFSIDLMQKRFYLRIKGPIESSNKIHNTINDNFNSSQYLSGLFSGPSAPLNALQALTH